MNPATAMRWLRNSALLAAAIPIVRWYAERMRDGGEMSGVVSLLLASYFIFRERKQLVSSPAGDRIGIASLFVYVATFPFLPPLPRALVFMVSLAFISGIARRPGISLLLVLTLPWAASLEFFFGYPLRLLTSVGAEILLSLTGTEVSRAGVQILHEGNIVGVDPACSGLNLLWTSGLFTALLAAIFSLSWRKMIPLGCAALVLSLIANTLRASVLFFPESGSIEMPHLLHPIIGLVFAAGVFAVLARFARSLSDNKRHLYKTPKEVSQRPIAMASLALCAAVVPLFSATATPEKTEFVQEISEFQHRAILRIELTPIEKKFYADFPGSIAVYQGRDFKLIVRKVTRATRKLHPAFHCLRAEGFVIGEKTTLTDDEKNLWLSYSASRNGETWNVCERVIPKTGDGQWAEISAWYWQAFFHPQSGPWIAETVISRDGEIFKSPYPDVR